MVDRVAVSLDTDLHRQVKKMAERDRRTFRSTFSRVVLRGLIEEGNDAQKTENDLLAIRAYPHVRMHLDGDRVLVWNDNEDDVAAFSIEDMDALRAQMSALEEDIFDDDKVKRMRLDEEKRQEAA